MAGSSDSLFFADGSQGGGFAAFSDDPFGGPGGSLDYDWGTVTYGINGGVVGCGGTPITFSRAANACRSRSAIGSS